MPLTSEIQSHLKNIFNIRASLTSSQPGSLMSVLRNFSEVEGITVRNFLTRLIVENPDFRKEPLLGAAILYLRTLPKVKGNCDALIYELIKKSAPIRYSIIGLQNHYMRREIDSGDEEIGLHNNKPFQNLDVRSPIVILIN